MSTDAARSPATFLKQVLPPLALVIAVMIGLGLLITKPLAHTWPFSVEDQLVRTLVADRTPALNPVSAAFSTFASTMGILVAMALVAGLMRIAYKRWRESFFLVAVVCAQLAVFLLTSLAVHRARPAVPLMDTAPPTSSFPSGHTSAAIALCGGIAIVLFLRSRNKTAAVVLGIVLFAIPVLVALARLYRGMHHPTDVAGSFVYGLSCLWVMKRAVFGMSDEYRSSTQPARAA
jgi:membrane-associated phospholipid phosphatase